jgi:hypothetical protein
VIRARRSFAEPFISLILQTCSTDGEDEVLYKQRSCKHLRNNSSDEDLSHAVNDLETKEVQDLTPENTYSVDEKTSSVLEQQKPRQLINFGRKLTILKVPERCELVERLKSTEQHSSEPNHNMFDEELEGNDAEKIPDEAIMERINSKKGITSYQLGSQVSCKWTTGAGPRISCVRDYPSELQFRALEQVNLSPRSTGLLARKASTPTNFSGESRPPTGIPVSAG